ncbi:MAG TPA: hypothetical protein DDZ81_09600 [Acetobacteraceae bacterium]|jgi:hypothetical protein|nr:hypothetical protein [Acetobacteraceae bacterium]
MSRIIEILLFLTPILGFAAWRLLFPSPRPPLWLLYGSAAFVVLMLAALFWQRHLDAGDAKQAYVPAQMLDGQVVPAQRAPPR